MNIKFFGVSSEEFRFFINNEEFGTVEKTITKDSLDGWVAIDTMDGFACEGKTKREAVESLYYKVLANRPDEEGNMCCCETHPDEICIKCLYK